MSDPAGSAARRARVEQEMEKEQDEEEKEEDEEEEETSIERLERVFANDTSVGCTDTLGKG